MGRAIPDPRFWRGKRVLVTGHTGFKGGWLSLWLQEMGAEVFGFALAPPTAPSLFERARVGDGMESRIGDIRDADLIARAVRECRPEIVLHLAAQPLVRHSYKAPIENYATNVMGLVHVLEAVRCAGSVKAMINVTSDKCYENRDWVWGYRESEAMGGHDPYSNSKGCAELVTSAYRRSFFAEEGIALASARAGNVIGGGDWAEDRIVPDILRAFEGGKTVVLRNPNAIRPWQHVLEPLSGYLMLAEKLYAEGNEWAEGWNLGPSEEDALPVSWIVEKLASIWGHKQGWRVEGRPQPHEAGYLKLDSAKIRARLGWRSRWRLDTALEKIAIWHRAHLLNHDMRVKTLQQIQEYQIFEG